MKLQGIMLKYQVLNKVILVAYKAEIQATNMIYYLVHQDDHRRNITQNSSKPGKTTLVVSSLGLMFLSLYSCEAKQPYRSTETTTIVTIYQQSKTIIICP